MSISPAPREVLDQRLSIAVRIAPLLEAITRIIVALVDGHLF